MDKRSKWTTAVMLTSAGLVVGAAGLVILNVAGIDFPTIPPGLVILLVAAGVVALGTRWWWTPLIGAVAALVIAVGGVLASPGWGATLGNPSEAGKFAGGLVQLLGLLLAIVAGGIATVQNYRDSRRTPRREA